MKTLFIGFDGIDGSGKSWAVDKLAARLRADGHRVWAGKLGELIQSARNLQSSDMATYLQAWRQKRVELAKEYDVVILDRSLVSRLADWVFYQQWLTPEALWAMTQDLFCDLNIVLQPALGVCRARTSTKTKPAGYWQSFAATMAQTVSFLKPRLGNRFVVFQDNTKAVEWTCQMVQRLNTHFDLHLTNACPLKCPTCCFGAGEGVAMETPTEAHWYEIVDAGFAAGINEFHLMGGEPLILGKKLVGLMRYIRERGGRTHLLTSGYDLKFADQVLPLADAVFVSLDGPRQTHNFTRGRDIFDNACEFIWRAKNHGCKIRIGTVVSRLNVATAHQVVDVLEEIGIIPNSLCWMNMSPTGGLFAQTHAGQQISAVALENYLNPDEWLAFVERLKNDPKISALPWAKVEPAFSNRPEDMGCELLQGKRRVMVMSDGSMYLCPMLTPLPTEANILTGDPVEQLVKLLSWEPKLTDPCGDGCQGGCLGYAKLFGNGVCDARCGKQTESRLLERFRLSEDLMRQGYRPICPCRTVKIVNL